MFLEQALNIINGIFSGASIIMGSVLASQSAKIMQIQNHMLTLINLNKAAVSSAKSFTQYTDIITSPILQNEINKASIILYSNIKQFKSYFKSLSIMMEKQQYDINNYFHTLTLKLPGLNTVAFAFSLEFLTISGLYTIYSIPRTFYLWKKYKADKVLPPPQLQQLARSQFTIRMFVYNPQQQGGLGPGQGGLGPGQGGPGPGQGGPGPGQVGQAGQLNNEINQAISFQILDNPIKIRKVADFQINSTPPRVTIFAIIEAISLGASLGTIALQIYGLVEISKSLDQVKNDLAELKANIAKFHQSCLSVLYNFQDYLKNFKSQLTSFTQFLNSIQFICTLNGLVSQNPTQTYKQIGQLTMEDSINNKTFTQIDKAITNMNNALQGMQITQTVNGNTTTYSTNQSFDITSKQFSAATSIFVQLSKTIDVIGIYNVFYKKIKLAQDILNSANFKNTNQQILFVQQVGIAIKYNDPLEEIQELYCDAFGLNPSDMQQADRYNIAQAISFSTKVFPKGSTNSTVYGYDLNSFEIKLTGNYIGVKTPIQDVSFDNYLSTWPQSKKSESVQAILKIANINPADLTYDFSSIYVWNKGTQEAPNWTQSRVQVFEIGGKKYYVLYDGVTNQFQKAVEGALQNILEVNV